MSPNPPIQLRSAAAVAAIAIAAVAAGCGAFAPSADGLLVATGGPLQVTDASGNLRAFDGPSDPVVAVTASDSRVIAATAEGRLVTSFGSGDTRIWDDVAAGGGTGFPLMAASPLGKEFALAVGEPQGPSFDLLIAEVGVERSQTIRVDRGLNGPPAWIGPGIVALDVIKPNGESAIATIDITSGAVTDDAMPGRVVAASIVGTRLAVDDPATGDVLVGDSPKVGAGPGTAVTRLTGPAGSAVDSLAMSADGGKLAIVRRSDAGGVTIEVYRAVEQGWTRIRTIALAGDGPVSVAWLD